MAQATILASAATAATSTDVTLAAGVYGRIGIFAAEGISGNVFATVMQDTPGDDLPVGQLDGHRPVMLLVGPGTWRVKRAVTPISIGVFSET